MKNKYIIENKTKLLFLLATLLTAVLVIDIFNRITLQEMSWLNESALASNQPVEEISMKEWVFTRLEQNLGTEEAINGMMIVTCESNWRPDVINNRNSNLSYDSGLWQINSIHKDISNSQKLDYQYSTDWAILKFLEKGNWSSWTCARKLGI